MKEKAIAIFEKYLSNFDKNNPKIKWKYIHSYRVADLMQEMAEKLNFDSHNQDLAYQHIFYILSHQHLAQPMFYS